MHNRMLRALLAVIMGLAGACAFSPSALPLRHSAAAAASSRMPRMPRVSMAGADDENAPILFNANAGWQADHNKAAAAMAAGGHQQLKINDQGTNQDTPDFFETEDGGIVGSTNALDGNINTRNQMAVDLQTKATDKDASGGQGKLQELLSTKDTMIKEFDRQTYTTTLQRMGGFTAHAWKVDGDWVSEPETFDLTFNKVAATGTNIFLQPSAMTFEDFLAGWTADSAPGFEVTPEKGTMDRRGGEETVFTVSYKGPQPTEALFATMVVLLPNDNFQWTFKFRLNPPAA